LPEDKAAEADSASGEIADRDGIGRAEALAEAKPMAGLAAPPTADASCDSQLD